MDLFPYNPRKYQKNIIHDIRTIVTARNNYIFESGTGSGKTICVLSSALHFALKNNKKIVYTTRTNAQQQQVILELRSIRNKIKNHKIFGLGLQGRANMCLLVKHNSELQNGTSDELSKFCSNKKKKVISGNTKEGCEFYRQFINNKQKLEKILTWTKENIPTAEEFVDYCEKNTICPYEINKLLVKEALVIVVPYIYIFDTTIRMMFFDWISISENDIILVIDEAHNLPEYLRELYSARLSIFMLQNCINEVEKVGDPNLANGQTSVSNFCTALIDIINNLRDTYVLGILENGKHRDIQIKNDAFIPSYEFESEILFRLKIISTTLSDIINDLIAYGEKIQEYRQKEGKLPRSYIYKLGTFLKFWLTIEMNQYIKLIVDSTRGKNPHIEAYCLDPSIATTFINNFHSSIHMSGTLRPLEEYRDSLGLPEDTKLVEYPSPFSVDNRRIFFTRDVTTRYEEIIKDTTIISKMWEHISTICNNFPKNTMVFFPSYNTLKMFQKKGYFSDIERCLYIEEQRMPQSDLIDLVIDFKRCGLENKEGAALFSVIGGRISEGVDFPAKQLEIAVIVGIPYPKPTARQRGLQKYYDLKFGKGWEYTVNAPAARKLLQSIGRLIRDDHDCGVAVILDKRAPRFKQYIQDMKESKNLLVDISRFLNT